MKLIHFSTISTALNLVLATGYFLKLSQTPPRVISRTQAASAINSAIPFSGKPVTNMITVMERVKPLDWRTVESDDYRQYVANLRAIGCPEKTLREIIMADVTDLFRERNRNSTSNRFEYWKPGLLGNAFDEKRLSQQQEQAKERREILKSLLGESYSDKHDPSGGQIISPMEQMTGDFLSPEKQATMKALEMKYAARILQAAKDGGGEDSSAMRKVFSDKDTEMLTVLSPDEKFEYDLRLSQPAILLRMNMGGFEPTEDEFRLMFQSAKTCTDKFGLGVLARLGNLRADDGEIKEMMGGLRSALGEQRFQQFQSQRIQDATSKGH